MTDVRRGAGRRALLPVLLFALYVVPQLGRAVGWTSGGFGPFCFQDELLYRLDAESIFRGLPYHSFHYPPLYPLLLAPAFLLGRHWYAGMLLLNAVAAASVVFPAWWIVRNYLPPREAFSAVALLLLLPWGLVYPPMVMSENLFAPLLCLAVYLVLFSRLDRFRSHFLFGLVVAALWATRYIAVVILPILAALWVWRVLRPDPAHPARRRVALPAFVGGLSSVLVPWIAYGLYSGESLSSTLFGSYSLTKTAPSAMPTDLAVWAISYAAYLVLAAAPVLPWVLLAVTRFGLRSRVTALVLVSTVVLGALSAASSYHSWRHAYNYPLPNHLLGRYLTVGLPVLFCAGIISLFLLTRPDFRLSLRQGLAAVLVSTGLVLLARAVLFGGLLRDFPVYFTRSTFNNPDLFGRDTAWTLVLTAATLATPLLLLAGRRIGGSLTRGFWLATTGSLLVIAGTQLVQGTAESGSRGRHPRAIARLWPQLGIDPDARVAIRSEGVPGFSSNPRRLSVLLRFFGIPDSVLATNTDDCLALSSDLVLRISEGDPPRANALSYQIEGRRFYTTWSRPPLARALPCIVSWGPTSTTAGRDFNIQPNGQSAMWAQGLNFNADTRVSFAHTVLRPKVVRGDVLGALVPADLYARPGRYEVYLFQEGSGRRSDPVWFTVEPPPTEDPP